MGSISCKLRYTFATLKKPRMAEKRKTNRKLIKYKYIFRDNYNPKYANGAYGGLTPRGEILLIFFMKDLPFLMNRFMQLIVMGK